jgi:16S rRNA U516 pseudouridylate synthase RsuA-like enzyme
MCEAVGNPVKRLVRVRIGPLRDALGPVLAEYPAVPAFTD